MILAHFVHQDEMNTTFIHFEA